MNNERIETKYLIEYFVYDEKDGTIAREYEFTFDENGEVVDYSIKDHVIIDNKYNLSMDDFWGPINPGDSEFFDLVEEITKEEYEKYVELYA